MHMQSGEGSELLHKVLYKLPTKCTEMLQLHQPRAEGIHHFTLPQIFLTSRRNEGAGSGLQSHSGHTFVTFLYSEISCLLQLGDPKPCKLFKSNGCNKIIIDFINVLPRLKAFARDGAEAQNSALDVCEAHLGAGHVLGWSLNHANSA